MRPFRQVLLCPGDGSCGRDDEQQRHEHALAQLGISEVQPQIVAKSTDYPVEPTHGRAMIAYCRVAVKK